MEELRFIDLFCGIGGFRQAMDEACTENGIKPVCVFSSDQAGNAVPVNIVKAVILRLIPYVAKTADMTEVMNEYKM
ncbi:MAG: hypothetical protein LBS52_04225 [Dysgonamonadaceae bacterium]|jgi:site-specific DNA-cytosine methylase|nr:hypothetical protein [Dysgonamonadaceae bacterium]